MVKPGNNNTEQAGKTTVTVRWLPLNATAEERKTFEGGFESMQQGWGGTFKQLGEYLVKIEFINQPVTCYRNQSGTPECDVRRSCAQPVLQTRGRCMPAILQACFT